MARFAVLVDVEVRGLAQYIEEDDEDYRHASIGIFLDPVMHGAGLGRDGEATLAHYLVDHRGHHRLVVDSAADNTAAMLLRRSASVPWGSCGATSVTPTARAGTTGC